MPLMRMGAGRRVRCTVAAKANIQVKPGNSLSGISGFSETCEYEKTCSCRSSPVAACRVNSCFCLILVGAECNFGV